MHALTTYNFSMTNQNETVNPLYHQFAQERNEFFVPPQQSLGFGLGRVVRLAFDRIVVNNTQVPCTNGDSFEAANPALRRSIAKNRTKRLKRRLHRNQNFLDKTLQFGTNLFSLFAAQSSYISEATIQYSTQASVFIATEGWSFGAKAANLGLQVLQSSATIVDRITSLNILPGVQAEATSLDLQNKLRQHVGRALVDQRITANNYNQFDTLDSTVKTRLFTDYWDQSQNWINVKMLISDFENYLSTLTINSTNFQNERLNVCENKLRTIRQIESITADVKGKIDWLNQSINQGEYLLNLTSCNLKKTNGSLHRFRIAQIESEELDAKCGYLPYIRLLEWSLRTHATILTMMNPAQAVSPEQFLQLFGNRSVEHFTQGLDIVQKNLRVDLSKKFTVANKILSEVDFQDLFTAVSSLYYELSELISHQTPKVITTIDMKENLHREWDVSQITKVSSLRISELQGTGSWRIERRIEETGDSWKIKEISGWTKSYNVTIGSFVVDDPRFKKTTSTSIFSFSIMDLSFQETPSHCPPCSLVCPNTSKDKEWSVQGCSITEITSDSVNEFLGCIVDRFARDLIGGFILNNPEYEAFAKIALNAAHPLLVNMIRSGTGILEEAIANAFEKNRKIRDEL